MPLKSLKDKLRLVLVKGSLMSVKVTTPQWSPSQLFPFPGLGSFPENLGFSFSLSRLWQAELSKATRASPGKTLSYQCCGNGCWKLGGCPPAFTSPLGFPKETLTEHLSNT